MTNGWDASAAAWIADMGEHGDYGREFVLDQPKITRVKDRGFSRALDVGCGEGRFCRMLGTLGIKAVGIDPTKTLIEHAMHQDPSGEYHLGRAETLDFANHTFDLVVSYLTLIDIPDIRAAISEMGRVLEPGGTLLIANLTGLRHRRRARGLDSQPRWRSPLLCRSLYAGARRLVQLAQHPYPQLASATQHLHVVAAGSRIGIATFLRADSGWRRPRQGQDASTCAVFCDDGMAEADVRISCELSSEQPAK